MLLLLEEKPVGVKFLDLEQVVLLALLSKSTLDRLEGRNGGAVAVTLPYYLLLLGSAH